MASTYIAYVQPLRQVFLRQASPGSLLSPYLFSQLDGTVWPDDMVSRSLSRACTRAQVPEFKVAWWRQVAASITKEKFTPKERANFNMDDIDAPEAVDEEDLIVDLAEGSNHSFRTFNYAYAGSTTLTMNTILHRTLRASSSWRGLFRADGLFAEEDAKYNMSATCCIPSGVPSTYQMVRLRTRPRVREAKLEETARRLHNNPAMRLRRPGQRDALLATMGPGAAEQVVVVLATGTGKTLLVMVAAALEGAGVTIIVLPTVALRSNMLERIGHTGIRYVVWSPGEARSAPLVIVSAEAACTMSFLEYAHRLEARQMLDRIVVDECHLTITATFRRSMQRLGSFVRQVRTQTVWMTATLPPAMEGAFIKRNMLVRPCIVRESTNRANIAYRTERYQGSGGLCQRVVETVRPLEKLIRYAREGNEDVHGGPAARIIIYCQTIELMGELAETLGCCSYTGDHDYMSERDRTAAIEQWLSSEGSPILVATSALGVGYDYAHVRWIVHAGPPRRMSDYAQESGRAGRDGKPATSIVVFSAAWQPYGNGKHPDDMDEEYMLLYLTQKHCCRAVVNQYMDRKQDWTWCMRDADELCGVCPNHHAERRPPELELEMVPRPTSEESSTGSSKATNAWQFGAMGDSGGATRRDLLYTGPDAVLMSRMVEEEEMERLVSDLEVLRNCCMYCRVKGRGRPFNHQASECSRRWEWQNEKKKTLATCTREGKKWMADYTACFLCYLPQTVCRAPDPAANRAALAGSDSSVVGSAQCRFADMIIPLCYGAFFTFGPREVIRRYANRNFRDVGEYMKWLGEATSYAGAACVRAIPLAALLLSELH